MNLNENFKTLTIHPHSFKNYNQVLTKDFMHISIYQKFIKLELNKPNESQQIWIWRHTFVYVKKWIGFSLYMPSSSLFLVTSLLFRLTQVSCAHHLIIEFLIFGIIPSIVFFGLKVSKELLHFHTLKIVTSMV